MGTMPVKPLIVSMSLPMMASMLVQALYNVVDSIFVAQVSEEALTAVTLSFPLQNLMIAVATGTGVGMNALLSRALGERDQKQVDHAANAGLFLALLSFMAFAGIGLFFGPFFIASQTNQPEILQYGVDYTRIVAVLSIGCFLQITCERLLQSTGKTLLSMFSQMAGAIINLILDPIMIFGWFGCPRMEVAGAATATVIGQIVAACIGILLNRHWNHEIHLRLRDILHPEKETIGKIYYVGVPSILMVSIGSVMTYPMNLILMGFSSTATAVFGAYFKLQSFFFMPVFGLNNGMIPVLAYNYGAGKSRRIKETLVFAVKVALFVMVIGTLVMQLAPRPLLQLFHASAHMMSLGIPALRIISLHFPIAAASIVFSAAFQAFSRSFYALVVSVARQLGVLIPVAYLLSLTGDVNKIWFSFVIAESLSLLLSLFFFQKVYHSVKKEIETQGSRTESPDFEGGSRTAQNAIK